ncbi:MAG TPA: DUF4147 domain-containing protein, partial [Candidatus Ozemobacteraceae bacterium]|nr:DUF4147 domain-containing protein [Candidatus Ozemobacteraceae bacterium]
MADERKGSELLRQLPDILIEAADTRECVRRHLPRDIRDPDHIIAVGKASREMLAGALFREGIALPRSVICVAPAGTGAEPLVPEGVTAAFFPAGHPYPDAGSFEAARHALRAAERMEPGRHVLALISGGASSLFESPVPPLRDDDIISVYTSLVSSGRPIGEVNTVRRHISAVKGGNLLRVLLERGAVVTVLAISDVPGDHPHDIGSGPFSPDPTTFADAFEIASGIAGFPENALRFLSDGRAGRLQETLKPGMFDENRYRFHCIASPRMMAERLADIIRGSGHPACLSPFPMSGERTSWVEILCKHLGAIREEIEDAWVLFYGELEVYIPHGIIPGRGGRATSLVLELASGAKQQGLKIDVAVLATDGHDGNSSSAGGFLTSDDIANSSVEELANAVRTFDAAAWLESRNRLYPAFFSGT